MNLCELIYSVNVIKYFFTIYDYIPTSTFPKKKSFLAASFPSKMFDMKNKMKSGIIKLKFKTISTQSENTHFSTSKTPFSFVSSHTVIHIEKFYDLF